MKKTHNYECKKARDKLCGTLLIVFKYISGLARESKIGNKITIRKLCKYTFSVCRFIPQNVNFSKTAITSFT